MRFLQDSARVILALWLALAPVKVLAGSMTLLGAGKAGSVNNLAFDAASTLFSATAASGTATITTSSTNDILIACQQANSAAVNSISDTAGLTWTQIGSQPANGLPPQVTAWWARSSGTLSGDVVTVNYTGSTFNTLSVFAISGAVTAGSPLDSNGALPGLTGSSTPLTLTTTNANTFLFACYSMTTSTGTAGSGWTLVPNTGAGFFTAQYKIVSTTQAATSAPLTTGTIKLGVGSALVSR